MIGKIGLIDNDVDWLAFARKTLEKEGYHVKVSTELVQEFLHSVELVLISDNVIDRMANKVDDFLSLRVQCKPRMIVMFSVDMTVERVVPLFRKGVNDCVWKPYHDKALLEVVASELASIEATATRCVGQKIETERR